MKHEWRHFLGSKVPRYTSYPTANAFSDSVSATQYRARLERVGQYEPISLYVHVPFCQSLCHYCGCNMSVCNDYSRAQSHVDYILQEIAQVGAALSQNGRVTSVHFGGGTPNFLMARELGAILDAVESAIGLTDHVEIAMEIDPRLVSEESASQLGALGVTRVSLGVQDFNPDVQRAIGRVQPYASVASVVAALRSNGIFDINFDLLYGLPKQSLETLEESIDQAMSLDPDRIALFGYAHLPEILRHQRLIEAKTLPGGDIRCDMMLGAADQITSYGYEHIGFDHFAKPGDTLAIAARTKRMKRNFQGFTDDPARAVIGFGASAISQFDDLIIQNEKHLGAYQNVVSSAGFASMRGVTLTPEDQVRADIIEQLLCFHEADVIGLCAARGVDLTHLTPALEQLKRLRRLGLATYDHGKVRIDDAARLLSRVVASCFDSRTKSVMPASTAL